MTSKILTVEIIEYLKQTANRDNRVKAQKPVPIMKELKNLSAEKV